MRSEERAARRAELARRRQVQLDGARRRDQMLGQERLRKGVARIGKSGRLARAVSAEAVFAAVSRYGQGIMTAEGEGFWRDQERRCPWIAAGCPDQVRYPPGRTRFGKAKFHKVYA